MDTELLDLFKQSLNAAMMQKQRDRQAGDIVDSELNKIIDSLANIIEREENKTDKSADS